MDVVQRRIGVGLDIAAGLRRGIGTQFRGKASVMTRSALRRSAGRGGFRVRNARHSGCLRYRKGTAGRICGSAGPKVPARVGVGSPHGVPHLQESQRDAVNRRAGEADSGVLPFSVGTCDVKVFVRQIVAAGEGHPAVHDHDLMMIPVSHEDVEKRQHRIETAATDS